MDKGSAGELLPPGPWEGLGVLSGGRIGTLGRSRWGGDHPAGFSRQACRAMISAREKSIAYGAIVRRETRIYAPLRRAIAHDSTWDAPWTPPPPCGVRLSFSSSALPWTMVSEDSVENNEDLTHAGGERFFGFLSC